MPVRQDGTQAIVNKALIDALDLSQSNARMQYFRQIAAFDDAKAVALYLWNVKLGQAFHFPLQVCEVSLRNSIGAVLLNMFGPNWWVDQRFDRLLDDERRGDIRLAEQRIHRQSLPLTSDVMIATLSFGFWASMLQAIYFPPIWSAHLRAAFPKCPPLYFHLTEIRKRAFGVLELRNKAFHHWPLIGRDLTKDWSDVSGLIRWICPVTGDWVKANSCVPAVIRERP